MSDDDAPDYSILPEGLRSLEPLITRYAESDDVDRSDLLGHASTDELRELVDAPADHWEAINAFLDENMEAIGPRQYTALALDSFAQASQEAGYLLEERGQ